MPSHLGLRRAALTACLSILVIFSSVMTVRAQGKKPTSSASTTTTGNSSWDQAIAVLQAQVDQQAALIAQLQSALAGETTTTDDRHRAAERD